MRLFARGGVIWLLAHELRLATRGGRIAPAWRAVAFLVLAAALVAAGAAAGGGLIAIKLAPAPLGFAALSAAMIGALALGLLSGLVGGVEVLYRRGDLDLLFSSPLDPRVALTVRALGVAGSASGLLLAVSAAAAVWLIVWGEYRAAAILPFSIGLAALAAAVALISILALFRWVGPRATRTIIQILAALFGASVFLAFQAPNLMPYAERQAWIEALPERIAGMLPGAESPAWLVARAATGEFLPLAVWLTLTLGFFTFVVAGFGRRYAHDAAALAAVGSRARTPEKPRKDPPFQQGLAWSAVVKEWRLLRRDPALVAQLLLQLVYLAPLLLVGFTRLQAGEGDFRFFVGTIAGVIALFSGVIGGLLTWLMISGEDAKDLVESAPAPLKRIERYKSLAAIAPTLVFIAAPAAAALAAFDPIAALWAFGWAVVAASVNSAIYTRHQRPMPRSALSTRAKAPFFVTVLSGVVNTSWSSAAGFCAAGWWPLALVPGFIGVGLALAVLDMKTEAEKPPGLERRGWFGLRAKAP